MPYALEMNPYGPFTTLAWVLWGNNWVNTFVTDTVDTLTANSWYHVVLTYDGAAAFALYVNGHLGASAIWSGFVPNQGGSANFGWRSDNDWKAFAGTVDDVAFYNQALTPQQIQAHYQATVRLTITKIGNDVMLSWPFGRARERGLFAGGA